MNEYEVTITLRVQGASMEDVPGLVLEAWGDHDVFPVYVTPLDGDERPDEIWIDKNTGMRWIPDQEADDFKSGIARLEAAVVNQLLSVVAGNEVNEDEAAALTQAVIHIFGRENTDRKAVQAALFDSVAEGTAILRPGTDLEVIRMAVENATGATVIPFRTAGEVTE